MLRCSIQQNETSYNFSSFFLFLKIHFLKNVNTNDLDNYLKMYINKSGMLGVDLKYVYNQKSKMEYINAKDLYKLDNAIAIGMGNE